MTSKKRKTPAKTAGRKTAKPKTKPAAAKPAAVKRGRPRNADRKPVRAAPAPLSIEADARRSIMRRSGVTDAAIRAAMPARVRISRQAVGDVIRGRFENGDVVVAFVKLTGHSWPASARVAVVDDFAPPALTEAGGALGVDLEGDDSVDELEFDRGIGAPNDDDDFEDDFDDDDLDDVDGSDDDTDDGYAYIGGDDDDER